MPDVAASQQAAAGTSQDKRQVVVRVSMATRIAAAVNDHRVLQQRIAMPMLRGVAVTRSLLLGQLTDSSTWVAHGKNILGYISRYDAPGTDDASRTDFHAWADDRPSADPHIRTNLDRFTELLLTAQLGIERMRRRIDLHGRSDQRVISDRYLAYVEHDAVEVEKALLPKQDIRAVVTVEWRLHPDVVASRREQFPQNPPAVVVLSFARSIELLAQVPRPSTGAD